MKIRPHFLPLKNLSFQVILLFGICLMPLYVFANGDSDNQLNSDLEKLDRADEMLNTSPDSSMVLYQQLLPKFEAQAQFKNVIRTYVGISDVYKNKGRYNEAYNKLWDALLLAEKTTDTTSLITVHRDLGMLYNIYSRYDNAEYHFKEVIKYVKKQNKLEKLASTYFSMAVANSRRRNFEVALKYLDSSSVIKIDQLKSKQIPFVDTQKGYVYMQMGSLEKASYHLEKAHAYFSERKRTYRIISGLYMGDLYGRLGEWKKANSYYSTSLNVLENSNTHGDKKAEILEKLAYSYKELGQINKAYPYLEQSISITDSLFNTRKTINAELFQMNNKYDKTIREKNAFIKDQTFTIERDKIIQSRLKWIIGFIIFIIAAAIVFTFLRKKLSRLHREKEETELEKEQAAEITRIKSRELTANTLQMIEKDNTIKELLKELKNVSPASHKAMKRKITLGNKDMWDRFNKRFIEVNAKFYENLRKKHPDLTPTEQKHCALIKLKFDSKEMASILNISLNSVHISRHRIRKKIGLERDDNLGNYIADI